MEINIVFLTLVNSFSPSKDNSKVEMEDNCAFLENCQTGSLEDIKKYPNQSLGSIKSAIPLVVNSERSEEDIRLIIDYFNECYPENISELEEIIHNLKADPSQGAPINEALAVSNIAAPPAEKVEPLELGSRNNKKKVKDRRGFW